MRLTSEQAERGDGVAAHAGLGADGPRALVGPAAWLVAAATSAGIYLFYFVSYPIRHLALPVGFDPLFYVWRSQYLASQGLGHGIMAARPGYQILSAVLGSITGRSQLRLVVPLSLVLVAVLALAVGAFAWEGVWAGRGLWLIVVVVTAVVVGPTHLVGENLSNLLNLGLVVAALTVMVRRIGGGRGMWAGVVLLVASGLAHWDFLAVIEVVFAVAFAAALVAERGRRDSEQREGGRRESGRRAWRLQEARLLAVVGLVVGGIMLVLIVAILRAPFRTVEVTQDALLYGRRFKTDLARLVIPALAGLLAVPILRWVARSNPVGQGPSDPSRTRRHDFAMLLIGAWSVVAVAGVAFGAATSKLPPARFLALLVAVPGAVAVGSVLAFDAGWVRDRLSASATRAPGAGRIAAAGVAVVALAALAVPAALRWYRYPVLMRNDALQQAKTAASYVERLPPHTPVIFQVAYPEGGIGPYETVVEERTIRIGLPPDRELDAHLFVGELADLLAGRRTPPPDSRSERITRPYWTDVQTVLPRRPPVLVLQAMAGGQFAQATRTGGSVVGPGVLLARGPMPGAAFTAAPVPDAAPSLPAGLGLGMALLALMGVAGLGWTRVFLGRGASPEVFAGLAPVVGAAMLILGGLVAAKVSIRLEGVGGVATYLAVALLGLAAAAYDARQGG